MKRVLGLAFLSLALTLPSASPADDVVNWKLTTLAPIGTTENTSWLFELETKDGKTTAKVLGSAVKGGEVVSFSQVDDRVRLVVRGQGQQIFEGRVSKDGKKMVGAFGTEKAATAAYMVPTEMKTLEKGMASKVTMTPEEFKTFSETASQVAKEHGAIWAAEVNGQLVLAMLARKAGDLAVDFARAAEKALDEKAPLEMQSKILGTVAKALTEAGKEAELKTVNERIAKVEKALDDEYVATVPPFKGKRFAGRKGQSDRAVVMELFTGAQCPPCVAADVAFDVLQKSYKPSELVLIQYHLHIPGPDPMTNSDTEGRWKYYRTAYGADVIRGTPTTIFDGKPKAGGGGAMAAAEKKYEAYRKVIDPLLEQDAGCKISATANRVGDKVLITAAVSGVEKPGKDVKLRLILVEENIRFVGSNKLRFHHQVVRAMPGGADGTSVENEKFSTKSEVDLNSLRRTLTSYLDNYAMNVKGFPQPGRPLDLNGLRVIAFVQDDANHEILQAVQVEVAH